MTLVEMTHITMTLLIATFISMTHITMTLLTATFIAMTHIAMTLQISQKEQIASRGCF